MINSTYITLNPSYTWGNTTFNLVYFKNKQYIMEVGK